MDPTWLLVAMVLLGLFASISFAGLLRRKATALEKTAADGGTLRVALPNSDTRP